jgi:alcohol dehydrogenase class IV
MDADICFDLRKFVAPEFIFGMDARLLVGRYSKNLGARKVLLVSDPGVDKAGWSQEAGISLEREGIVVERFNAISPNPKDLEVAQGADRFMTLGCDSIVAVGGGSVMDCAKGIGIVVSNGGSVLFYEGVDRVPVPMPPLICIPTTGGTAADVSQFAIINNTAEKVKIAIISKALVPDLALIDPKTLVTMSPYLTACTGMDVLAHAIEAFVSNAHSAVTDLHALEAVRLLTSTLYTTVVEPDNLTARGRVMLASLQAGLAFSNASLGVVHSMAHSLGGFKDLPHGECNALLLPHAIRYNFESAAERYKEIGRAMGLDMSSVSDPKNAVADGVKDLAQKCGIEGGFGQRGVSRNEIRRLAEKAINDPCNATNPRKPTVKDLEVIFGESL